MRPHAHTSLKGASLQHDTITLTPPTQVRGFGAGSGTHGGGGGGGGVRARPCEWCKRAQLAVTLHKVV